MTAQTTGAVTGATSAGELTGTRVAGHPGPSTVTWWRSDPIPLLRP